MKKSDFFLFVVKKHSINTLKKIVSFVLVLLAILLIPCNQPTKALGLKALTEEECVEIATKWSYAYHKENLTVSKVIPVSNGRRVVAYSISLAKNDQPYGYAIVSCDKTNAGKIIEYASKGVDIATQLERRYESNSPIDILYNIGFIDYGAIINDGFSSLYGVSISSELLKAINLSLFDLLNMAATSYNSFFDGFYWGRDIDSEGFQEEYAIDDAWFFMPSTMDELVADGGFAGNCSPTAVTNLLSFYSERRGFSSIGDSREDIYRDVVKYSGWNEFGNSGMSMSAGNKAMKKICTLAGYKYSSTHFTSSKWSKWKSEIKKNMPIYTYIAGYAFNSDTSRWEVTAHAVVTIGYQEYTNDQYLMIWDDWNDSSDRYISFNGGNFYTFEGYRVKIYE